MQELPLYRSGKVIAYALVDDADYEDLKGFSWRIDRDGYPYRGSKLFLHNHILPPPDWYEVDHINGKPLDNRRENLRHCNRAFQNRNSAPRGWLGWKGVHTNMSGNHYATIWLEGREYNLGGSFDAAKDAARAFDAYYQRAYPDWCAPNFPGEPLLSYEEVARMRRKSRKAPLHLREANLLARVRQDSLEKCAAFKASTERSKRKRDSDLRKRDSGLRKLESSFRKAA